MELDKKERLLFSYLLRILEKLEPEEAEYHARNRKAIEHGYKLHYNWITENLYDEMPEEECKFVLDVLDMYRSLNYSYESNNLSDEDLKERIRFRGFDGNNETRFMGYAHYFMHDLDRYNELHDRSDYPNYNTHHPTLKKYTRMIEKWRSIQGEHRRILSVEEIGKILDT